MINSNIGYMICESDFAAADVKIQPKTINGKVIAEVILQTADEQNRNGRYYSEEELFPQLKAPRTVELLEAGALRAECGHPLSKDLQRQSTIDDTRTCARFLKLWTEGKNVMAWAVGTNSPLGIAFDLDLKEGCKPAWSLRALGSVERTARGAEVKNLRVITWDNVIYPSHPGAYTQKLVTESALTEADKKNHLQTLVESADYNELREENDIYGGAKVTPIINQDVINFLEQDSKNLKFVRECFDFAYSGIETNKNGTKVVLTTNEGATLVVNMETYIHNELMNYSKDLDDIKESDETFSYSFLDEGIGSKIKDVVKTSVDAAKDSVKNGDLGRSIVSGAGDAAGKAVGAVVAGSLAKRAMAYADKKIDQKLAEKEKLEKEKNK